MKSSLVAITDVRLRKTTETEDRHIIITTKSNYDLPVRDITNLSGLPIPIKTSIGVN